MEKDRQRLRSADLELSQIVLSLPLEEVDLLEELSLVVFKLPHEKALLPITCFNN